MDQKFRFLWYMRRTTTSVSLSLCFFWMYWKTMLFSLITPLVNMLIIGVTQEEFTSETIFWQDQVRHYWRLLNVNKTEIRNVMDMNAFCGGFAVALNASPTWVMNIVPSSMKNTLSAIYNRGLIGAFHDW